MGLKFLYDRMKCIFLSYPVISYLIKWTLIALLIGVFIGSASAGFLYSLEWATDFREVNLWVLVLLPSAGFFVGLLYYYYGKEVESGNNLLLENVYGSAKRVPFRMAPFVYVGTIVTHFFGGSAGREGTALQMAGAIADQFSKPLRLSSDDRKTLIVAAIAGGFGAVFGTPLAGAVFGLELIFVGRVSYRSIFPVFMTAIVSDWFTKLWQAHHTHYCIDFVPEVSFLTMVYTIIAGVCFGLCAMVFSKAMKNTGAWFKSNITFPPMRPFVGGALVALAVWLIGSTKYIGLGIPTIVASFEQQLPAYDFVLKMVFTVITLSAGFKGGEVTPLFFIGATLGSAMSCFLPLPVALLAGIGFVAVFSGATNTPLACSIMAIELFGVECGVYAAIACVVSYLVSGKSSIYTKQLIGSSKIEDFNKNDRGEK